MLNVIDDDLSLSIFAKKLIFFFIFFVTYNLEFISFHVILKEVKEMFCQLDKTIVTGNIPEANYVKSKIFIFQK